MSNLVIPEHENDASLDIETMGRAPGCCVLSIGMTMFDPYGLRPVHEDPSNHFYVVVNSFDSQNNGFSAHSETSQWWKNQPIWPELAEQVQHSETGVVAACKQLAQFMAAKRPKKVWANSPTFDIEIMRAFFKKAKIDLPLNYRQEMDFRSIMELAFPQREQRPGRPAHLQQYLPHHALGDAILQAHQIIQAYQELALLPSSEVTDAPDAATLDRQVAGLGNDQKDALLRRLLSGQRVRLRRGEIEEITRSDSPAPSSSIRRH